MLVTNSARSARAVSGRPQTDHEHRTSRPEQRLAVPLGPAQRRPDPLISLPDLAARLNITALTVKDESARSPLGSFKALGRRSRSLA